MSYIINVLGTNHNISGWLGAVPLQWSVAKNSILSCRFLYTSKTLRKSHILKSCFLILTLVVVVSQTYFVQTATSSLSTTQSNNTANFLVIIILAAFAIYSHVLRTRSTDIATFLNAVIQFDQRHFKTRKNFWCRSLLEKLIITMEYASALTTKSQLLTFGFAFGLHWTTPLKPTLAGYWLIVNPTNIFSGSSKLLIILFNYLIWEFGFEAVNFCVTALFTGAILELLDDIQM